MRLPALPAKLNWDHNAHYHDWMLRQLPDRITGSVLDVGCGDGALARRLARRSDHVDAIDVSAVMIAKATSAASPSVRWIRGDVLDTSLDPGGYAAVVAVSSLHHLPLRPGLARMAELVAPGGTLAVVGLYRPATLVDRLVDAIALPANLFRGIRLSVAGRGGKPHDIDMPVRDPEHTLDDLRRAATDIAPGARIARRLYWRYTLVWHRPATS